MNIYAEMRSPRVVHLEITILGVPRNNSLRGIGMTRRPRGMTYTWQVVWLGSQSTSPMNIKEDSRCGYLDRAIAKELGTSPD